LSCSKTCSINLIVTNAYFLLFSLIWQSNKIIKNDFPMSENGVAEIISVNRHRVMVHVSKKRQSYCSIQEDSNAILVWNLKKFR
jgi:hypothetical protein